MEDYRKIAIELGQTLISKAPETREDVERMLPELKESEGERIRKLLVEAVTQVLQDQYCSNRGVSKEKVVAWLEKQGKKTKPIEGFNTEFERQVSCLIASAMNKDYEYTKDFVKWTSDALLNYAKLEIEKNSMGISEATKKKLEDNLHKALEKETPESWNKFLDEQGEQKPVEPQQDMLSQEKYAKAVDECIYGKEPELVDADDLPKEEPVSEVDFEHELYKAFGQVKDFTLGMRIAKWFYDMGKRNQEPVSERFAFKAIPRLLEMIEPTDRAKAYIAKLADTLELEGYSTDAKIVMESLKIMNGEKVAMATMDEEPVSEDLEEAAFDYAEACKYDGGEKLLCVEHFKAGAKWQIAKLMEDAIDVEVKVDAGGYPYIDKTIELYDYDKDVPLAKEGDKYKVILIKEE